MKRLEKIRALDGNAMHAAKKRWNRVAKPLHSMGILEDYVIRLAGVAGSDAVCIDRRAVVVMCGDHGVVAEGVTQSGSEVTRIVAEAMAEGDGNINNLARVYHADVFPVDMGISAGLLESVKGRELTDCRHILDRKTAQGTQNIAKGPAMTPAQAEQALTAAIDIVGDLQRQGYQLVVTGEMGIGNTTPSSAIAAVLLNERVDTVTGRGAGLDSQGLCRKQEIIRQAIAVNLPDRESRFTGGTLTRKMAMELLYKLGGYDIAGMTGLFLGGGIYGMPVVMDGFISSVAAALAIGICPAVKDYIFCAHVSGEPAGALLLQYLGMSPVITAGMCLGEGTGGIMLLPLLDGALAVYASAHSFDKLCISQYEELT